jgi:hypothetical protein
MRAMFGDVVGTGEELYQNYASDKPSDVGPEGDAAAFASDRHNPADKLDHKPITQHRPGRQGNRSNKEAQEN